MQEVSFPNQDSIHCQQKRHIQRQREYLATAAHIVIPQFECAVHVIDILVLQDGRGALDIACGGFD